MLVRWNLIVCSLTHRSRLIAAVVSPPATADRIDRSRSVSAGSSGPEDGSGTGGLYAGVWNTAPLDTWRSTAPMSVVYALFSTYAPAPARSAASIVARSSEADSTTI